MTLFHGANHIHLAVIDVSDHNCIFYLSTILCSRPIGGNHLQFAGRSAEKPRLLFPRVRLAQIGILGQTATQYRSSQDLWMRHHRRLGGPARRTRQRHYVQSNQFVTFDDILKS